MDVQPRIGQCRRDLPQHVGHVGIGNGKPVTGLTRHGDVGKIHGILDIAVFEIIGDLLRYHDGAVFLGFFGRSAEVGQGDEVGMRAQQITWEVTHIGV